LTREQEISYLKSHNIEGDWEKAVYSVNQGLWGTSVGGKETLTSDQFLPEDAFPFHVSKQEPIKVKLSFEKGEAVILNGKAHSPIDLINALNEIANAYGIGRDIHVGDTIIGIKGRVGFVAAATLILIKAHHLLEKHVLTKQQLQIKDQLSYTYGNLVHEGQFLDPAMRDIEQFLDSSQQHVTGEVEVLLAPYRFQVLGVNSPNDLMQTGFGSYGEMNEGWTAQDARGFAKIFGNQTRIYRSLHDDE
jgi:argininosuccinate synthase